MLDKALFLKDLAEKTKRGQRGRVERVRIPGGKSYGYNMIHFLRDDGQVERGQRTINEAEANVVRRIFENMCPVKALAKSQRCLMLNKFRVHVEDNGTPLRSMATLNAEMVSLIMSYIWVELSITDKAS